MFSNVGQVIWVHQLFRVQVKLSQCNAVFCYLERSATPHAMIYIVIFERQLVDAGNFWEGWTLVRKACVIQFHELVAQNKRRRSYVGTVEVAVRLEAYSVEARAHFETIEEQARNNEIFVHWLRTVLGSLALWSDTDRADVELWIEAQSPSDVADRQRKKDARMDPETDILYHRFEHSYLHLSKNALEDLAPVNAVGTLLMKRQQRLISPASCSYLAVKLPRLQKMQLKLGDDEKRDSQLRKRNREGMPLNPEICHYLCNLLF